MDWHTIYVEYLNLISMSMVCFQFFMQITRTQKSRSLLVHQIKGKIINICQLLSVTSLSTTLGYNYTYVSIDNKLQSTHLIKVGSFFNQW